MNIPFFKNKLLFITINLLLACCMGKNALAQQEATYQRVQYQKLHWRAYHAKQFSIYFPADAADSLYRLVAVEMPQAMERIRKATLKEVPANINVVIYPSVNKAYESNIGMYEPGRYPYPVFVNRGKRVVISFNGSYTELKADLDEALVRAMWESQVKGGEGEPSASTNKKGTAADIPYWFKEGAIRYFAHHWRIEDEGKFRQSFASQHFTSWQQVTNWQPRLAGQAFCYFVDQQYFPKATAQTIFQLKKKKSLARAIRLVTKTDLDSLTSKCLRYYAIRFEAKSDTDAKATTITTIHHPKGIVQCLLLNQSKTHAVYTVLYNNKRTVYISDLKTGISRKATTYKLPPWIDEHSKDQYPLLQWHKNDQQFYVALPVKGKVTIKRYSVDGTMEEQTILEGVDGIRSFQPLSDREFLLTAYREGQSDIISYNDNKGNVTGFTDDEYDDASPIQTGDGNGLLWMGNRPKKYNERRIYLIGVGYKKDTLYQGVYRKTDTLITPLLVDSIGYVKYDRPVLLSDNRLLLTTTKSGKEQYLLLNYETGKTEPLGDFEPAQYITRSDEMTSYKVVGDSISFSVLSFKSWLNEHKVNDIKSAWLQDYDKMKEAQAKEDSLLNRGKDTTHYAMDDIFKSRPDEKAKKGKKRDKAVKGDGAEPYILQLHSAYFTAQVNNNYFINRYQPYFNYQGQFKFPEVGGMTKGGFTDLLENHHFNISYRLPAATEGSDINIRYENTAQKVDWGFSYFRKVETLKPDTKRNWVDENGRQYPSNAKVKTHHYEFLVRRPLTFYSAITLQLALRQDRTIFLATDKYTLDFPALENAWSINTLSYRINKLKPTLPGLFTGYKANGFLDGFKGSDKTGPFVFGLTTSVEWHKPLYKYITLVTQVHAGYSGGDEKILYNLGGTNNNVTPQQDTSVHFAQAAPYAFQTLVAPFRGRLQNSLYGNKYALINLDVYVPIFQTLIPLQTPLPFINNLQFGMLCDMATARETWHIPSAKGNSLVSYGFSMKSSLAGYPLRIDLAWPGTFSRKPLWYFSLSL